MATGSKTDNYWNSQSVSYLPRTLTEGRKWGRSEHFFLLKKWPLVLYLKTCIFQELFFGRREHLNFANTTNFFLFFINWPQSQNVTFVKKAFIFLFLTTHFQWNFWRFFESMTAKTQISNQTSVFFYAPVHCSQSLKH